MKSLLLIGLLLLTACERNEFSIPIPVGGGGGSYSAPSRTAPSPNPTYSPLVPPNQKMMENPDAEVEYDYEDVWAKDQAEANEKCKKLADQRTREGGTLVTVEGNAQQQSRTPSRYGQYRFSCRLRAEQ